jgi:hypothetical protein
MNKIQATESLASPVRRYSFGIINGRQEELQKLDRKTRKLPTTYGQHQPKAGVDHLYVLRKQERRDHMQLEEAYVVEIIKLVECVDSKEEYRLLERANTTSTHQCYRQLDASREEQDK